VKNAKVDPSKSYRIWQSSLINSQCIVWCQLWYEVDYVLRVRDFTGYVRIIWHFHFLRRAAKRYAWIRIYRKTRSPEMSRDSIHGRDMKLFEFKRVSHHRKEYQIWLATAKWWWQLHGFTAVSRYRNPSKRNRLIQPTILSNFGNQFLNYVQSPFGVVSSFIRAIPYPIQPDSLKNWIGKILGELHFFRPTLLI
jgi:hypothetical protein